MKSLKLVNIINEQIVKDVHKMTRTVKSVTNEWYPFYLIKDYMDVGYWDRVSESSFKKAYNEVIDYLLNQSENTKRLAKLYNWVTNYDELWKYQEDKED
jgi:hypothetical protein